ncbi:hypothetical protein GGD66_007059 [Bradyrhizobium sp. CIR48]|uniref:hypothetical protein n=1 Tax=Bradyrhizobium sp. CIR48 TaxID=2663840 RepID=UPI0017F69A9E|nr:hypothetical protein [Bradyrhizobium sp. CIR48]MBB4428472.1 hypothetical protein [Bradyrhizobium sp. CIR48]
MNIQTRFDLETAEDVLAPQIKKITSYEAVLRVRHDLNPPRTGSAVFSPALSFSELGGAA